MRTRSLRRGSLADVSSAIFGPGLTELRSLQVVIRALASSPELINWSLVPRALLGLLALLCGNGYIVGINQARLRWRHLRQRSLSRRERLHVLILSVSSQVYDVDIDKVNKPFLPVASGEMSMRFAWVAVRTPCRPARSIVQRRPHVRLSAAHTHRTDPLCFFPSPQCIGLAILGGTIVSQNFGPLITVRDGSPLHTQTRLHGHARSIHLTPTRPAPPRAAVPLLFRPLPRHHLQRPAAPPQEVPAPRVPHHRHSPRLPAQLRRVLRHARRPRRSVHGARTGEAPELCRRNPPAPAVHLRSPAPELSGASLTFSLGFSFVFSVGPADHFHHVFRDRFRHGHRYHQGPFFPSVLRPSPPTRPRARRRTARSALSLPRHLFIPSPSISTGSAGREGG